MLNAESAETQTLLQADEARWRAVQQRHADDSFVYAVVTTGIFCRPSCPSRKPLRQNVRFFPSAQAAADAGFRSCLRCAVSDSMASQAQIVVELCAWMDSLGRTPSLAELSRRAGLSPFHLQRTFRQITGVTPAQYARMRRMDAFKTSLRDEGTITEAIYSAGFESASRVYDRNGMELGMTPGQYRGFGRGVPISYASAQTSLGCIMLAATDRGLCFIQFGDSAEALRETLAQEFPRAALHPMKADRQPEFAEWIARLERHLAGCEPSLELPLDVRTTAFRLRVWQYLRSIPYGSVQSYTDVAQNLGIPRAVRAVASACAANPVALVIPCHRVLRSNGELGGYRWGLDRKKALLAAERASAGQRS